ncbi:MAG: hypothetical protein IJE29_07135 [Firmicutes bacterium]|nr:hypothetical protein [Bacillota bacterium]
MIKNMPDNQINAEFDAIFKHTAFKHTAKPQGVEERAAEINTAREDKKPLPEYTPDALSNVLGELVRAQLLWSKVLPELPVNLLLVDEWGRVLAATVQVVDEVLHSSMQQVVGGYLSAALGRITCDAELILALDNAVAGGFAWSAELTADRLTCGQGHWGIRLLPIDDNGRGGRVNLLLLERLDTRISDFWQIRQLMQTEANMQLTHMGKLSGGVLHEVKNIVQNFSGVVQVMQTKCPEAESVQGFLRMMNEQIAEMNKLLYGFMGLGRCDENVTDYSLNEVIEETLRLLYPCCRMQRMEVLTDLAEDLPLLYIDRTRIKQVLLNCLENSMEAIEALRQKQPRLAGEIKISTAWDEQKQEVSLLIEDNGIGITAEQQAHLMRPFYTSKPNGTGLGVSISRGIIALHGGSMELTGRPEQGCQVRVVLPYQTEPAKKYKKQSKSLYAELVKLTNDGR